MQLSVGQEFGPKSFQLTRDSLVRYAGASGDFNPIHYRDDIAQAVGLPGVLAHGMLTMGVAVQLVVELLGDSSKVSDYQVRFTKPVVVDAQSGATLVVSAKVIEIDEQGSEARIDLTASFNDTTVLGKAQLRVKI
jgi:acyl dehydratase